MMTLYTKAGIEVRLTGEEFIAILEKELKGKINGFVILDPDPSPTGKIVRQAVVTPLDKTNFVGNIRSLRDTVKTIKRYLTLAEARWAIENWEQWLQFIDRYNRLPSQGYGTGEGKGRLL
jgi:hypothetical protein